MPIPAEFARLIASYNSSALLGLVETLATTQPEVSVRFNTAKGAALPSEQERVPWCQSGIYLDERPTFTFDPRLHQGLYYVQDASSMIVGEAVARLGKLTGGRPLTYLDACAAPGGKTISAIDALPTGSTVFTNEYDYRRASILAENIAKWGNPHIIVTRGDTARYSHLVHCFDIIAADVPCSGEGMMRKEPAAVAQWSPALVDQCATLQRQIVDNLWPALRPGGFLIYSTCTFNRRENEENIAYICRELGGSTVDLGLDEYDGVAKGIDTTDHCYRLIPGRIRGEGMFVAIIRKDGDSPCLMPKAQKKPKTTFSKAAPDVASKVGGWLDGDYTVLQRDDSLFAVDNAVRDYVLATSAHLDIVTAGVFAANIKGRDIIPTQQLALSTALRDGAFTTVDVDRDTALAYLRCESLAINCSTRGYVLLTYGSKPLGFVKNLGNRANNLYPRPWRILSQTTPKP